MINGRYTVVLKTLMDDEKVKPLLDKALSTYPMYTPINQNLYGIIPTRDQLNNKILNHYKYREIGFETVGRFLDELEISMNEIMPYYYALYKSADILNGIDDPFGNVDITETFEEETFGTANGTSKDTSNSTNNTTNETSSEASSTNNSQVESNNKHVKSSTPQGVLDISNNNIDGVTYADEVNWSKDNSNSTGNTQDESSSSSNSNSTNSVTQNGESTNETSGKTSHIFTKVGNQGVNTYAHDMKELREIFINIEQMIINDERISELFMRIY